MTKDFFVGVYDPIDVRRNILESSKHIVKSLQSYESLHKIRQQKLKTYKIMKTLMQELELLIKELDERLPSSHTRRHTKKIKQKKPVKVQSKKVQFERQLLRLGEELRKVEDDLKNIQSGPLK